MGTVDRLKGRLEHKEYIDSYIGRITTIKTLIRYKGKNESCGDDIINAEKIFQK